jgi:hypothetical protein
LVTLDKADDGTLSLTKVLDVAFVPLTGGLSSGRRDGEGR